jgi:hypothetical protein
MNRRLLFLNLILLVAVAALVWAVRTRWTEAQNRERAVLQRRAVAQPTVPPQALPPPTPAQPTAYVNVAQQMLFSSDRNPNVILPPPPPPAPEKKMPPLPAVHGSINAFGEHAVLLSLNNAQPKTFRAGQTIGEFKIVDLDAEKIKFEWDGKEVERNLRELQAKDNPPQAAPPQPAGGYQAPGPQPSSPGSGQSSAPAVTKLGSSSTELSGKSGDDSPQLGVDMGGPRACVAGDNSPDGTVVGNYRKKLTNFLGMKQCHWEQIK